MALVSREQRTSMKRMDPVATGVVDLSDDILQICFARLPLEDVPRVKMICRRWQALGDPQLLRQLRRAHGLMQTCTFILDNKYTSGRYQGLKGVAIDSKTCSTHHIATLSGPQRLQFGAAGIDGQIYVLGGRSPLICRRSPKAWIVYSRVDVYEPLSNSWRERQPMHVARYGFAAGAVEDLATDNFKIIVAGGYNAEGETLSSAEVYDFRKDQWEAIPSMHIVCGPCRGEVIQGKFIVQQANGGLDAVEIFDLKSCRWASYNPELSETCMPLSPERNATSKSITLNL